MDSKAAPLNGELQSKNAQEIEAYVADSTEDGVALVGNSQQYDDRPPVRLMAVVMFAAFQAYAAMQNLQGKLKHEMGIGQFGDRADMFTNALTMLHVGKLVARLAHNIICACVMPLHRVYVSLFAMAVGMAIPPIFVWGMGSQWIGLVFISYGLIGIGIGIFEATFLAVITPLGNRTKYWAILGIPTGFVVIGVPGFILLAGGLHPQVIYWWVIVVLLISIVIVQRHAPRDSDSGGSNRQASIGKSLNAWRSWLPTLLPHLLGKMFVNFGMENLFPVILFTYNAPKVPLFGPTQNSVLLNRDVFQAIMNLFIFAGDTVSRRIPYYMNMQRYSLIVAIIVAAMMCDVLAFLLTGFAVAWLAWISIGLAFWGNGLVYAVGSKYIDHKLPKEHHLAAYSSWCFMGDISSVVGAKSQDMVRSWVCKGTQYLYECLPA